MNVKVDKQENSKVVLEFTMDKETFEKAQVPAGGYGRCSSNGYDPV